MGKVTLVLAVLVAASGCSEASSLFTNYYPNMVPGFIDQIHAYQPQVGQYNCFTYWCQSSYTNQYYCCTTPLQQGLTNVGFNTGYNNFNQPYGALGGYNQYNPYGSPVNAHNPFGSSLNIYSPYGNSLNTYNPFGNSLITYNPYGNTASTYNPYGNSLNTYSPYRNSVNTYNPYGNTINSYNPHGMSPSIYSPYG